jgi:hypothetical protein
MSDSNAAINDGMSIPSSAKEKRDLTTKTSNNEERKKSDFISSF